MFVINISDPITLLLLTVATVLLIFLGKEIKKPFVTGIALVGYLFLIVMHAIQLATMPADLHDTYYHLIVRCIAIDFIMIFMTFFAYLWIDDIASKFYKRKSIDNSLDWFWNKTI